MKKLKQERFFEKLKEKKVSLVLYETMLHYYKTKDVSLLPQKLQDKTHIVIKFIEQCDELFLQKKKIPPAELMGSNYKENIELYINTFPSGKLPNGKYARSNSRNIEQSFVWFFSNYNYSWSTILKATHLYVEEFRRNNYLYMRTANFFVKKVEQDKSIICDLADYCERVANKQDYIEQPNFKARVI
jgi:hypothetical protein